MARLLRRIVDASPLILLGKIGRLDLLRVGGPEVVAPGAVLDEVGDHGSDEVEFQEIVLASWIRVAPSAPIPATVQAWDLAPGNRPCSPSLWKIETAK